MNGKPHTHNLETIQEKYYVELTYGTTKDKIFYWPKKTFEKRFKKCYEAMIRIHDKGSRRAQTQEDIKRNLQNERYSKIENIKKQYVIVRNGYKERDGAWGTDILVNPEIAEKQDEEYAKKEALINPFPIKKPFELNNDLDLFYKIQKEDIKVKWDYDNLSNKIIGKINDGEM